MAEINAVRPQAAGLRIKELGLIFLAFLLGTLLLSTLVHELVNQLAERSPGILILAGSTRNPDLIVRGLMSLLTPLFLVFVTLCGLKCCLPEESLSSLVRRYGFCQRHSLLGSVVAFMSGAVLVQLFTNVLIPHFEGMDTLIPNPQQELNRLPYLFLVLIAVSAFTFTPIAEELLFRGVLYTELAALWNRPISMFVTSVIFISLHSANLSSGSTLTHIALVVVTVLLVLVRELSGALHMPVLLHSGFNFSSVLIH